MATFSITTGQIVVKGDILANDTLSGLTSRNGVTPVAGDLMLATAQTDQTTNGPYIARASTWDRVISVQTGQSFFVSSGTDAGKTWQLKTASITPASFNSSTGACGTNLTFTASSSIDASAPGPIGGTTPSTVTATDYYLGTSAGSPVSGEVQLSAVASATAAQITAGTGSNVSIGQVASATTARAAVRTLSITLATNATYDFDNSSFGGSAVIATTDGAIAATIGFSTAAVTTTGGATYTNFSTTLATSSKLNVAASGGKVRFENKTAGSLNIVAVITLFVAA